MNSLSEVSMSMFSAPRFDFTGAPGSGKTSIVQNIEQETPIQAVDEAVTRVFNDNLNELSLNEYSLKDLHHFADGLNDEGGTLEQYLKDHQVWTNLCAVLDRPYEDGIEFDDLTKRKNEMGYQMKEQAIPYFNERQANLAYAMVMHYYISHAHAIAKKKSHESVTIHIHTFRKSDGPSHLQLLKNMLEIIDPDLHLRQNITILFSYGIVPNIYHNKEALERFRNADIILTFSVILGMNKEWPSGTLLIPNKWIPFSAQKLELYCDKAYHGRNHLAESIRDLIASETNQDVVQRINTVYHSMNTEKKDQKARALTEDDFKQATLIELNGFKFNPSKMVNHTFQLIAK